MPNTIDYLQIEINGKAQSASNEIDMLVGKLDRLTSSLKKINTANLSGFSKAFGNLSKSSKDIGKIDASGISKLSNSLSKLNSLNVSSISRIAKEIPLLVKQLNGVNISDNAVQIGNLSSNISKLGNKSVETAITNIPKLATALNGLMTTLSNSPQVSQNVIQMTNAMANLSSQGSKVSTAANSISGSLDGNGKFSLSNAINNVYQGLKKVSDKITVFGNNLKRAEKNTKKFTLSLSSIHSKLLLISRALSGLWGNVESAMDYMEVVNYFDAAFGQVADNAVSQWEEMGYDSAEAYYNSFGERAQQLSAKMSGFTISDTGLLESTRQTSLGINPSTLMNYQAMFAQMSSSMGITSETALQLSNALTMIGADLASVKNMDFDKVWNDMASGLAGMSRTLDKYGVNIRNVNLQEKLHELGINANIQALNQNDKALLRTIILLDSTRYAWADLADTLNAPANQFRLLRANIETLSRTIGAIFLPIVSKILPYINGLVIAIQRLFSWIAKLMGIDLSGITNSTGSGGEGIGDLLEDTEDLGTGLDDATDSAKKLKRQLQGFDALNVLSSQEETDTSGLNVGGISGLLDDAFLDAFSEYQKVWDEAFDRLENRAEEIADSIEKMAKHIFEPIRKAWKTRGKYVLDGWKKALKEIGELTISIGEDLDTVWQQDKTVEIFEDIFTIVGNIGYAIGFITENFKEAWNSNDTGLHILENIRDIIGIVVETFREMSYETAVWAQNLDFENLLDSFESFTGKLGESGGLVESVSGILSDFYTQVLLPLGKWAIEEGLPNFIQTVQDIINKIDWELLRTRLSDFWTELEPFAKTVGQGLIDFIGDVGQKIADFVNSEEFGNFLDKVSEWLDDVTAEDVKNTFEAVVNALIGLKTAILGFKALSVATSVLSTIKAFLAFFGVGGAGATVAENIGKTATSVSSLGTALSSLKLFSLGGLIGLSVGQIGKELYYNKWEKEGVNTTWIDNVKEEYGGLLGVLKLGFDHIEGYMAGFGNSFNPAGAVGKFGALEDAMTNISNGVIYTDVQLARMQKTWDLTTDDMEMLRQEMLDVNPELREIADNFGLFDSSIQTLMQVQNGLALMEESGLSASEALEELEMRIGGMITEDTKEFFNSFSEENAKATGENITNGIIEGMKSVDFSEPAKTIFEKANSSLCEKFGIHSPAENMEPIGENILLGVVEGFNGAFDSIATAIENLKTVFQNKFTAIKTTVLNIVSNIVSGIVSKINYALSMFDLLENVKIPALNAGNKVLISVAGKMPGFAGGGYPNLSKPFVVGERGPEIYGGMFGKPAIANSSSITDGIEEAAYRGMMRAIQESGGFNSKVDVTLEANTSGIFQVVRQEYNSEARRQGASVLPVWG